MKENLTVQSKYWSSFTDTCESHWAQDTWPYSGEDEQLVVFPWKPSPASVPMHMSDMLHRGTSNQLLQRRAAADLPSETFPLLRSAGRVRYLPASLFATAMHRTCASRETARHEYIYCPFQSQHWASTNLTAFPRACCMEETNILKPHADSQHPRCSESRSTRGLTCRQHSARHSWQSCSHHPGDALHKVWEHAYT